jgi:hypothetical protein
MVSTLRDVVVSDRSGFDSRPAVRLALWDTPPEPRCRPVRTDTFCTGLVMWCKDVYLCRDDTPQGHEETKTPYPCGVCVGVTPPSDW